MATGTDDTTCLHASTPRSMLTLLDTRGSAGQAAARALRRRACRGDWAPLDQGLSSMALNRSHRAPRAALLRSTESPSQEEKRVT
jgi:hypothetical protein